jgi:hypothetical protein
VGERLPREQGGEDMEGTNYYRQAIPFGVTETAWLRDNARKGAGIIYKAGERFSVMGLPTTYADPDTGRGARPLYA